MRAAVVEEYGAPLALRDVPTPDVGADDVLVRVEAAGVCATDLKVIAGGLGADPGRLPLIPGHEITVRVPSDHLLALPPSLTFVDAAPLLCAGLTVYAGFKNASLRKGQRVAILGIGGLGHLAIPIARALGADVAAVTTSDDKAATARRLGASVVAGGANTGEALRAMGGVDVVLNTAPPRRELPFEGRQPGARPPAQKSGALQGGPDAVSAGAVPPVRGPRSTQPGSTLGAGRALVSPCSGPARGIS